MQLEVEAARVADGFAVVVAPPEGGGGRLAVGTSHPNAPTNRRRLLNFRRLICTYKI
jgi:hypothetical protein